MKNNSENINVYFDYTCPWVRQAGYWLMAIEKSLAGNLRSSMSLLRNIFNL